MKIAIINLISRSPLSYGKIPLITSNMDVMIIKFAQELKRTGFDVDVYISDAYKPVTEEYHHIEVIYVATVWKWIFWPTVFPFTPSLVSILKDKYDVIIASEIFQAGTVFAIVAKHVSRKKKPKVIVWQEMARYQKFFKRIPAILYHRFFWRLFCDSHVWRYVPRGELAQKFLQEQDIETGKITAKIPHGIDENIFFPNPSFQREKLFFVPSRLVFSKGIDVLLRGFAMAMEKYPEMKDFRLVIQGIGPLLETSKMLALNMGISRCVEFSTKRVSHKEMRELYRSAVASVFSSRSDLMLFSVMESLACGTPVIVSSGADIHFDFMDNIGGVVFSNENYKELSDLFVRFVQNEAYRKKMFEGAIIKSTQYFNKTVVMRFSGLISQTAER